MTGRRVVVGALAVLLTLAVGAAPAAADPPRPTDFQSEIVGLTPPSDSVEVEMIGGDSFVRLTAEPGVEVEVQGYRGEPYLRFNADGTVERNEQAPSRWLNDDRYGEAEVPASADPEAEPVWLVVGHDGTYVWHDHRTHWMSNLHPPGAEPGDVVLEAVVPLTIDGVPVAMTVRSTLLAPPSPVPALAGAALAVVSLAIAARQRRGTILRAAAFPLAAWAAAAIVIGGWAYLSVPATTGPSILLWAPALVAAVLASVALWGGGRRAPLVTAVLLVAAGLELAWWAWLRRAVVVRAVIPSTAPAPLDRAVVAGSLVAAVAALVAAGAQLRRAAGTRVEQQPEAAV